MRNGESRFLWGEGGEGGDRPRACEAASDSPCRSPRRVGIRRAPRRRRGDPHRASAERRAIIGPNGAGKTTLFSLISGEQPVDRGHLSSCSAIRDRVAPHRRAALGLSRTHQRTNLFPRLTVLDSCVLAVQALRPTKFHLHRSLRPYPDLFARARSACSRRWASPARRCETVANLSHGEQRQLEIALALAGQPRLLLLDDPTAGPVASRQQQLMAGLLKEAGSRHHHYLMIEHDMDIAFQVTDRITVLHYGSVVADGLGDEGGRPIPWCRRSRCRGRAGISGLGRAWTAGGGGWGGARRPTPHLMLEVRDIHTYYGDSHVLQGVSLSMAPRPGGRRLAETAWAKRRSFALIIGFTPPRRGQNPLQGARDHGMAIEPHRSPLASASRPGTSRSPSLTVLENLAVATPR